MPGGNNAFSLSGPGTQSLGTAVGGYNNAINMMGKALDAGNNTTGSQMGQLGQQLQQNQASIGQNLTNRGLGNTTVAQTMQQAPLQTYNSGVSQVQNQGAMRNMQQYNQLAGMYAQGGQGLANSAQPYAQTNYQMSLQKPPQGQQVYSPSAPSDFMAQKPQGQGQQNPYSQYQNLQPQQPLSFGPGQPGGLAGSQAGGQSALPQGFGQGGAYVDPNQAMMDQMAAMQSMGGGDMGSF
jgi:hypothetical protein